MLSLPIVESPLAEDVFSQAVDLDRGARHDLEILHRDRDFSAIAQISVLRQRSP